MLKQLKNLFLIFGLLLFSSNFSSFHAEPFHLWLDYHVEVDENDVAHVVCESFDDQRCRVILM